jgi:hypothetical protein
MYKVKNEYIAEEEEEEKEEQLQRKFCTLRVSNAQER